MTAQKKSVNTQTLIEFLSVAADAEQVSLQPLPPHATLEEEEHLRRHYALILAALLTAQEQVSETQSRLLVLLLDSLGLGDIRAQLFDTARNLEPDTLLEAARLIREANWQQELLVDALILLRLDAALSADTVKLIGELAAFLGIDANQVELRANHAAQILGLGDNTDEILAQHWPQHIPYQLTAEQLQQGITGGLWFVNEKLEVNFSWQASNAVFIFEQGASIYTDGHTNTTELKNCQLNLGELFFAGVGKVSMDGCTWHGSYTAASYAFFSIGVAANINNCEFITKNATAITINGANIIVKGCRFVMCGSRDKQAGAIYHANSNATQNNIESCHFNGCIGQLSGAIWTHNLNNVNSCEFIDCTSINTIKKTNLAVYTKNQIQGNPAINNSTFRNSCLSIGLANWSSSKCFIRDCRLDKSNIYYHNKTLTNSIHYGCIFNDGTTIEQNLS